MNKRTEYILVSLNLLNNKLRNLATKFWENRRRRAFSVKRVNFYIGLVLNLR